MIAVLCAAKNSVYHKIPGIEVYDINRNARTFPGGMPIIAHPPCRSWSVFCKHQAKPEPGERELGLWCCDKLRECGGILEQPAFSDLFLVSGLPIPGERERNGIWSLEVWQAWWGYHLKKNTWLAFSGIKSSDVMLPLKLHNRGLDRRNQQVMSKKQRSATTLEFAVWMIDLVKKSCERPRGNGVL